MITRSTASSWTNRILPNHNDAPEKRILKIIIFLILGMILLMTLVGLTAFWLSIRGEEDVFVPDVSGKELINALIAFQEKELYPKVEVRYSSEYDKGIVINQKPAAGSMVKVDRRITLVVSEGPVMDSVGMYVGEKLDDVRIHLRTLFASSHTLLKINEVIYNFDESSYGTILAQKPEAGTRISGLTNLNLVVSRGPRGELIEVGDFMSMNFQDAIAELAAHNLPFVFTARRVEGDEEYGVIISQSPEPQSEVPYGSVIQLVMTQPKNIPIGKVFGMFEYRLPDYPIMVDISLDSISEEESTTLLSMKHPGGPISIPYITDEKSELVLYIVDKEEIRQQAGFGRE